jgi:hypothetical protein
MKLGRCENCETLRDMLQAADRRYDQLMEKYHSLRVNGANAASVGLAPMKRDLLPADDAIEFICEKYPHFRGLRQQLQRFVNMERQKPNADEDKIAVMVREWERQEDDGN